MNSSYSPGTSLAREDVEKVKKEQDLEKEPSRLRFGPDRNRMGDISGPEIRELFENLITEFAAGKTFNEREAAEYLKTPVESVRYYALRQKELAYHMVGRNLVFTKKDLDAFLASRRVTSING